MTPRCNCRRTGRDSDSLKDALCRALEQADDPCPVHSADEVQRRDAEREAQDVRDAVETTAAEIQDAYDLEARRNEHEQRQTALAALAEVDPMGAEIVARTGAPIPMVLNATAAELAPRLGMTPHSPTDGPPDAA